jgi:hypothetical protein
VNQSSRASPIDSPSLGQHIRLIPNGTDAHYLPSQKAGWGKCEKRYARGGMIPCNTAVLVNRSLQLPDKLLSAASAWAEPSQVLIGMWPNTSQLLFQGHAKPFPSNYNQNSNISK